MDWRWSYSSPLDLAVLMVPTSLFFRPLFPAADAILTSLRWPPQTGLRAAVGLR